jgi:DNA-binding MltR family transcriptional regulator
MSAKKKVPEKKTAEEIGVEIIQAMDTEFRRESDRVMGIVGAAYLDSLLDSLLRAVLIDSHEDVENLLRPDAPLGSNGARYQLAYCLGLIRKDQRDDLKIVAKIRNLFAHDFKVNSFDVSPIREHCGNLKQPGLLAGMPANIFPQEMAEQMTEYVKETTATPREKFETTIIALFGSMLRRVDTVTRTDKVAWFSSEPDPGMPTGHERS